MAGAINALSLLLLLLDALDDADGASFLGYVVVSLDIEVVAIG